MKKTVILFIMLFTFSVSAFALPFVAGDVNGDGILNVKDLARLKKYFARPTVEITVLANCNGDNSLNAKDLTHLKKYFAGMKDTVLYFPPSDYETEEIEID